MSIEREVCPLTVARFGYSITMVRGVHVQELRSAVILLEGS
jgi:hypothetical protein